MHVAKVLLYNNDYIYNYILIALQMYEMLINFMCMTPRCIFPQFVGSYTTTYPETLPTTHSDILENNVLSVLKIPPHLKNEFLCMDDINSKATQRNPKRSVPDLSIRDNELQSFCDSYDSFLSGMKKHCVQSFEYTRLCISYITMYFYVYVNIIKIIICLSTFSVPNISKK